MKNLFLSFSFLLLILCSCGAGNQHQPIKVMSFNIRMDTQSDSANQWSFRKDLAASVIRFHDVDIFGSQEVLHHQLTDMLDRLPGYDFIGVGRADGKQKGEYSPIIFKKDRFTVEKNGNFWLAEDMNAVGKKGWDAACERVASWGIFKDKLTGKRFFFLNTHLDHMGKVARHEGAKLVLEQSTKLSEGLPILATGDYNAVPEDDPIQVLTNKKDPNHFTHVRDVAAFVYGPDWTFHDYGRIPYASRDFIDYIFMKGNFKVSRYGVLTETLNHLYPSDHCPVIASIELQ